MGAFSRLKGGRVLVTFAAARKCLVRAFVGSVSRPGGRQAADKAKVARSAGEETATPPVSPVPGEGDLVSFYLLRHGETNFNAIGRIQGTLDESVLTEAGIAQASEAGRTLAANADLNFGPTVVVSPMGRAQQTLSHVREQLRKHNRDFKHVEVVPNIREIELFEWQGELKQDIIRERPDEYTEWVTDPTNFNFAGRYPARDLWARAAKAWEEIRSLQSIQDQSHTLVVAHNAINQALVWTALGEDTSLFRKLTWPNCAVLELQWRRGQPRAERYRWLVPTPSPFVEIADAARLCKAGQDDTEYTL